MITELQRLLASLWGWVGFWLHLLQPLSLQLVCRQAASSLQQAALTSPAQVGQLVKIVVTNPSLNGQKKQKGVMSVRDKADCFC